MKTIKHFATVLIGLLVFTACQKEFSLETGIGTQSVGSIVKDTLTNNCLPIVQSGSYIVDSTLKDSSYVLISVNITTPGSYKIVTDVQNNFFFQDSGFFSTTGIQTVKLKASGKPLLATTSDFLVQFGSSFCMFPITAVAGTGGGSGNTATAKYTLAGSPTSCSTPVIAGTYTTGTALNATNTVTLNVIVDSIGTYSVTTAASNGMVFSGSGSFTTTGPQTIRLTGSGTPVIAGSTPVPVTAGGSSCGFAVTVVAGTGGGTAPTAADSAWSFNQGTRFFYGPTNDIYDTTIAGFGTFLGIEGATFASGDTLFDMILLMPGSVIQSGNFTTTTNSSFYFYNPSDTVDIYAADPTLTTPPAPTTTIVLTYNSTTKLVTGTFSGTALNASGVLVPITNGKFRGIMR